MSVRDPNAGSRTSAELVTRSEQARESLKREGRMGSLA